MNPMKNEQTQMNKNRLFINDQYRSEIIKRTQNDNMM